MSKTGGEVQEEFQKCLKMVEEKLSAAEALSRNGKDFSINLEEIRKSVDKAGIEVDISKMEKRLDIQRDDLFTMTDYRRGCTLQLTDAKAHVSSLENQINVLNERTEGVGRNGNVVNQMGHDLEQAMNIVAMISNQIKEVDIEIRKLRLGLLKSEEFNRFPDFNKAYQETIASLKELDLILADALATDSDEIEEIDNTFKEYLIPNTPSGEKIIDYAAALSSSDKKNGNGNTVYRVPWNGNGSSNGSGNENCNQSSNKW